MLEESTRVPSPDTQELARKASQSRTTSGGESRSDMTFTGKNRSDGLSSSYLALRRNMLSKPAVGKAKICIRLLTNGPFWRRRDRVSAADDFRAVDAFGCVS